MLPTKKPQSLQLHGLRNNEAEKLGVLYQSSPPPVNKNFLERSIHVLCEEFRSADLGPGPGEGRPAALQEPEMAS